MQLRRSFVHMNLSRPAPSLFETLKRFGIPSFPVCAFRMTISQRSETQKLRTIRLSFQISTSPSHILNLRKASNLQTTTQHLHGCHAPVNALYHQTNYASLIATPTTPHCITLHISPTDQPSSRNSRWTQILLIFRNQDASISQHIRFRLRNEGAFSSDGISFYWLFVPYPFISFLWSYRFKCLLRSTISLLVFSTMLVVHALALLILLSTATLVLYHHGLQIAKLFTSVHRSRFHVSLVPSVVDPPLKATHS